MFVLCFIISIRFNRFINYQNYCWFSSFHSYLSFSVCFLKFIIDDTSCMCVYFIFSSLYIPIDVVLNFNVLSCKIVKLLLHYFIQYHEYRSIWSTYRGRSVCLCCSVTSDLLTGGHCLSTTGVCPSVKHITALILSEPRKHLLLTLWTLPDRYWQGYNQYIVFISIKNIGYTTT